MLVYREHESFSDASVALRHVIAVAEAAARTPTRDAAVDLLIELGEFEAAVTDRLFPEADGLDDRARCLRGASLSAAHAVLGARQDTTNPTHARSVLRELTTISAEWLPRSIAIRISEGYAYYALHPHLYAGCAGRFMDDHSPAHAVCLGIRSIGTSLSAVVAAALETRGVGIDLYSVRRHGHPFHRTLSLRADLAARLRRAPRGSFYLVIDEGPGLSGSSFASVAEALVALGVPASRIVLFASWDSDGSSLKSDDARKVWTRHQRYAPVRQAALRGTDWSAGAWRRHVLGNDESVWPAVQPQHEVEKAYLPEGDLIVRFAGLGRYGRAKLARAETLAAHGLGPLPQGLQDGYLSLRFVSGAACRKASLELCDAMAAHAAFLTREFPAERSPSIHQLQLMTETNLGEGGVDRQVLRGLDEARAALASAPTSRIDGRMMPHDWIRTNGGSFVKVDALDHHADHFFPGIQDAGWDLAAAAFEFDLDAEQRDRVVSRYAAASGDRDVRVRLPFFDVAYPAFRLGYATLASQSVSDPRERTRFARVIARCRDRLMSPSAP